MLGPLVPAWSEEGEQSMGPFQLTKSQIIPQASICEKSDADAVLGSPGPICRVLYGQGTTGTSDLHCNLLTNHLRPAIRSEC
jgi:hypothetical protein